MILYEILLMDTRRLANSIVDVRARTRGTTKGNRKKEEALRANIG